MSDNVSHIKLTETRKSILECLETTGKHMSADEIYKALNETSPSIGIATVYRNLNYLYDHGYLSRFQDKEIGYIYDINTHNHYHFKCRICHQVYDVDLGYQNLLNEAVAKSMGIENVSHDITFEGICKNCSTKGAVTK